MEPIDQHAKQQARRKKGSARRGRSRQEKDVGGAQVVLLNDDEVASTPKRGYFSCIYTDNESSFRSWVSFCCVVSIIGALCLIVSAYAYSTVDGDSTSRPAACDPRVTPIDEASVPDGFCAYKWADGIGALRGALVIPPVNASDNSGANHTVVVVSKTSGSVWALWDANGDGQSDESERMRLVNMAGLNHGVAAYGAHLYASTATTVYRWPWVLGTREPITASSSVIVKGMPDGGHTTRTIVFDGAGFMYVNIGSGSNVDSSPARARVMRYDIGVDGNNVPSGGIEWTDGVVFANGTRNEVGFDFDSQGRLWGVENGVDNLNRESLGGDIHKNNPGEELNLFETVNAGAFYGYPYCWSVGVDGLETYAPGTQFAHGDFLDRYDDAWCQNAANVLPPIYVMPAHQAPLGMRFYVPSSPSSPALPFNAGDLLVSFHGSWNREPPAGYSLGRVRFGANGMPAEAPVQDLFKHEGDSAKWVHRPVDVVIVPCAIGNGECILITSDSSEQVIALSYSPESTHVYEGKEIEIDVESDDKIERVKEKVAEREGIPPPQQRLIFGGKQLVDEKTIQEYGIEGGNVLHLVLALRGGM